MDSLKKKRARMIEEAMNRQIQAYIDRNGRAPGPEEPVFFDLDHDIALPFTGEKIRQRLAETAMETGADPTCVLMKLGFDMSEGKA